MKKHIMSIATIVIVMSVMLLVGCNEERIEAPVATPTPVRATAVPIKEMSEQEARKILEKNGAETLARWSVEGDPKRLGYDDIRSFNVSSIELTKTTDTTFYFTLHGSFYGVDKYGSYLGKFIFDYDVSVDKSSKIMDYAYWAKDIRKK